MTRQIVKRAKRITLAYVKVGAVVAVIFLLDQARKVRNENRQARRVLDTITHGAPRRRAS